jgi:hypothetical protein
MVEKQNKDTNPNEQIEIWGPQDFGDPLKKDSPLLSRRQFILGTALLATAAGFGYATKGKISLFEDNPIEEVINPEKEAKQGTMVLGEEETILQKEMVKVLNWVPDGPITFWTTAEDKKRYLLTGGKDNATYMLETDGSKTLKDSIKKGNLTKDDFKEVYSPDKNIDYRKHYVGITSVLQLDSKNKDHLTGIVHCEQRVDRNASATFTATIGLVESFDAGSTWADKGPLIVGSDVKEPGGDKVSGAGQPTAILNPKDGFVYILYIDWASGKNIKHADQIYLARAKGNDNGSLGELQYFNEDGFSSFKADKLKSVIPVPEGSNLIYTALPSVSFNTELNQYICTGEADNGFWLSKSRNLIDWSKPEIIYDFEKRGGKPHSILKVGEKWDSYPTALDESKENSQITGKTGIFYHSSGDNVISHEPAALDYTIV